MKEMPIFTRTFDFLAWLMPMTNHFPRSQRFLVTKRLLDAALDFQEAIVEANNRWGVERLATLEQADELLDRVRIYLRLAARWEWLKRGQYRHAAQMVAEIGRLLGGWQRTTREQGCADSVS
jgi:four helix bundle protein